MALEDHLRTLRGAPAAIGKILEAYQAHRGDPGAGARVLEALDALEQDALKAEQRLMELIFADLDLARARIGGE